MIETDERVIYQQIWTRYGVIGISQVHKTLFSIDRYLIIGPKPKNCRDNWCRGMMQRFADGESNDVHEIDTCYESWIYCYDSGTKRQPTQRVFPFEELPTKIKRGRNVKKR
ncbi:hypothetical protein EVAR_50195_1 [Eumeta japonica]|uniref:Mariner Mos1 transposase n=1 Tax=Eumeta variegata TaxID=151549 RepID=A0A4C1WY33_EUMVA|nr:hypothetical protein EVAR_50195_1 [Eumeta japonica]